MMKGNLLTIYLAITATVALGGIITLIYTFVSQGKDAPLVLAGLLSSLLLVTLGVKGADAINRAKDEGDKPLEKEQDEAMEEKK